MSRFDEAGQAVRSLTNDVRELHRELGFVDRLLAKLLGNSMEYRTQTPVRIARVSNNEPDFNLLEVD